MEETNLKSQNRFLKVILVILFIPIIAAASIAGYLYLPDLMSGKSEPWEKDRSDGSKVNRSAPQKDEPANNQSTASNTTPNSANTVNVASANANSATPAAKTNTSSFPLTGRWLMTGPDKTIYVFSALRTVGSNQTGTQKTILKDGTESTISFNVVSTNRLKMLAPPGSFAREVTYSVSANGKTAELHLSDGGIMYFNRVK